MDESRQEGAPVGGGFGRRHFLVGASAATAATAALVVAPGAAEAAGGSSHRPAAPLPKPIPGGIDSGDPRVGFIHWFLPGPTDATTPVLGLQGMGLDVEPNTITDFKGWVAYAVLAGEAVDGDGTTYPCEFDVRAMKGSYLTEDGSEHEASFAFL